MAKKASLLLMNRNVCWPCIHLLEYVLAFPDLFIGANWCFQMELHIFVFDEELKSLRRQGSVIDLSPFYTSAGVSIVHACFVHGSEEILFVDSSAQARIFSLITLQPKYLQFFSLRTHF